MCAVDMVIRTLLYGILKIYLIISRKYEPFEYKHQYVTYTSYRCMYRVYVFVRVCVRVRPCIPHLIVCVCVCVCVYYACLYTCVPWVPVFVIA